MSLIERAKNICISPKSEWELIATETTPTAKILTGYVLPLAAVAAIAGFIGMCFIGQSMAFMGTFRMPVAWGLAMAIYHVVMAVVSVFVVGFLVDALAPTFGGQKNMAQAIKIPAYSYTPVWLASVLMIIPALGVVVLLAAIYAIYLIYLGLPRVMKSPPEKAAGYTAVVVISAIVVAVVISVIGGLITAPALIATGGYGMGGAPAPIYDKASPMGKLDEFSKKMEEAGKKMEAAEKSGDPNKQMEAALGALGTAFSGGKGVEPLSIEELKPVVPETFSGLPRTSMKTERSGVTGFTVAKAQAVYGDASGKHVALEVMDTGGAAGLMGLATWMGVTGEVEDDSHMERTRREGRRLIHEEVSKRGGANKYSIVLGERFVVSAEGRGVDLNTLKSGVASLDLAKFESMK